MASGGVTELQAMSTQKYQPSALDHVLQRYEAVAESTTRQNERAAKAREAQEERTRQARAETLTLIAENLVPLLERVRERLGATVDLKCQKRTISVRPHVGVMMSNPLDVEHLASIEFRHPKDPSKRCIIMFARLLSGTKFEIYTDRWFGSDPPKDLRPHSVDGFDNDELRQPAVAQLVADLMKHHLG